MSNEYREKIEERVNKDPSEKETIYVVEFLMPIEWAGEGKRLEFAEKKYKSKGWAEKFFDKEPLAYRLLRAKEETLKEKAAFGVPLRRRTEKKVLETRPVPRSKLEGYYVPSDVERFLGEWELIGE